MDRKEKKRDISTFVSMMKDIMNKPANDPLEALERDLQHFLYGRVSVLVKHNDGKPIGTLGDVSAIMGSSAAEVIRAFCGDKIEQPKLNEFLNGSLANLVEGFKIGAGLNSTEQAQSEEAP